MATIEVRYEGSLRTQSVHTASNETLITDAPVDNHGKGESFSPTDLVATGLGSCMMTIMAIVAERHGWDLSKAKISVTKVMTSEPVRRIARLETEIRIPGEFDGKARAALERAALGCPVHATLHGNVELPVTFHWGH